MHVRKEEFLSHLLDISCKRVLLISNNRNLTAENLVNLQIKSDDLVVQFNTCVHYEKLTNIKCHKAIFFNIARHGFHFGFTKSGTPLRDFTEGSWESLCLVFAFRTTEQEAFFLSGVPNSVDTAVFAPSAAGLQLDLAPGKLPSIGYKAIMLFHKLNLERTRQGGSPIPIVCAGFNAAEVVYHTWVSGVHDFYHEHRVAKSLPNVFFV